MSCSAVRLRPARRAGAFTLAEMLIVIGIIMVLAALLLSVRSRATDKAAQVTCMNNLRQIGMAMVSYAQDNEQLFPCSSPLGQPQVKEDWVAWQGPDPLKAVDNSALAKYVGTKGVGYQALMRCPSDDWSQHALSYPYSYSMNFMMSSDRGKLGPAGPTPRLTSINSPAEKILVAEENELTINDGLWAPGHYNGTTWMVDTDLLSIRHDTHKGEYVRYNGGPLPEPTKRGNVAFVDGHADFVGRKFAHSPQHLLPRNEGTGFVP